MDREKFYENIIVPFALTFLIFLFLPGPNYYIFGQDSIPFFGQFTFYQNPFYSFNNGTGLVYFSLMIEFVVHLFHNVVLSQRILIFIFTYISTIGFFDLIDVISQLPNKVQRITSKTVGAMLFLYNPFTLSVTWWHFEDWSILILVLPFIISFFTDTVYNGGNLRRFSITTLLTMVFAPGISGGIYPFFLLTTGIFLAFPVYKMIRSINIKIVLISASRRIAYIVAFVSLATLWVIVPLYQYTFASTTAPLTGSFLLRFFYSESSSTTLPNVLSLTGFSWIYEVPSAYPWIHIFPMLQATAFLLLFFIPTVPIILRKYHKIAPLILVVLFAILFSTGANFPFGYINENLLLLKGPFLFLINPYYWVLQFYVLFLAILLSLLFYNFISISKTNLDSKAKGNSRHLLGSLRLNYPKVVAVFLVLFIMGAFFYPFATDQVYQETGPNIDAINIDNGLLELRDYLKATYSSPDYYTLLIPTSSGSVYLTYNNNSTFADSRGIISTIDPYPLIWIDDNFLASSVENYLSSNNLQNVAGVLSYLHIRYVIFTKNYSYNSFMEESPDGAHYNFSSIFNALKAAFGNPIRFGSYYLFFNPSAKPCLELVRDPISANTTLLRYLDFLGSINPLTLPESQIPILYNAIISNASFINGRLSLLQPSPEETIYGPSNQTFLIMKNGTFESPEGAGFIPRNGIVSIKPTVVASLSNHSGYATNMIMNNGSLFSNKTSYVYVNSNISAPSLINISFEVSNLPYNHRNYFSLQYGNLTIQAQFINSSNGGNPDLLTLTANFTGRGPYAWNNIFLPADSIGSNISLSVLVFQNYSLGIGVRETSPPFYTAATFYYGTDNYFYNPGYSASNFETGYIFQNQYKFKFDSGGNYQTTIYNFTISEQIPIRNVIIENIASAPSIVNLPTKTSIYGNYYISDINPSLDSYLYFFGPPAGNWVAYAGGSSNTLPIFEKNNFSITYELPKGEYYSSLQIEYQSFAPLMLEISFAEAITLLSLLAAGIVWGARMRKI